MPAGAVPLWQTWAWTLGGLALSVVLALIGHALLYRILGRIARRSATPVDNALVDRTCGPTRLLFPLLAFSASLDEITTRFPGYGLVRRAAVVGVILAVAWTILGFIRAARDIIDGRYRIDVDDNLAARRIRTQVELLQRIAVGLVAVATLAAVLMTFPSVRQVGLSLFASAGVAGLVVGIAARPVLGNMIAGIQIALSQPIRLDDIVVVEGEFGRVEEINITYVVIRIWDERRMVVPLTYFIEKPFTNWTRTGSALMTPVFIYADYRIDVESVRAELGRIVRTTELWDGRVANVQVTDATDRAVQLRALVSARSAQAAGDLGSYVRERLVAFLRTHPEALPVVRAEVEDVADGPLHGALGANETRRP